MDETLRVDSRATDISVDAIEALTYKLRGNAAFLERKGWSKSAVLESDAAKTITALRSALTEAQQEIAGYQMGEPAVIGTVTHYSSEQLLAERDEARASLTAEEAYSQALIRLAETLENDYRMNPDSKELIRYVIANRRFP